MRHVPALAAIAVVLASVACGSEAAPQAHTNKYVTVLALTQVEADLGVGAVVVAPVDTNDDDPACTINSLSFNNCVISSDQPAELHVQSTLCEIKPNEPTESRFFVECRAPGSDIVRPRDIPHCPGHG